MFSVSLNNIDAQIGNMSQPPIVARKAELETRNKLGVCTTNTKIKPVRKANLRKIKHGANQLWSHKQETKEQLVCCVGLMHLKRAI